MKTETVLAFKKDKLFDHFCSAVNPIMKQKIISMCFNDNIIIISKENLKNVLCEYTNTFFIPREVAESSEEFIHLIPYVVVRYGEKFLSYWRNTKAGESRLHNKMSLGIGGHINTTAIRNDGETLNVFKTITANIASEFKEELGIRIFADCEDDIISEANVTIKINNKNIIKIKDGINVTIFGLILSGSSGVNSVHAGLILMLDFENEIEFTHSEDGLETFNYYTIDELQQFMPSLESWSQTVLNFLIDAEFEDESLG